MPADARPPLREVFGTVLRVVTFRASREELVDRDPRLLPVGLLCTWVVGMGRWWDDPGARLLQHLGVGSVAYAFVLSAVLWLLIWPLRPRHWSYSGVLTFVLLTSPPAILYAIPVEMLTDLPTARALNLGALAIVAAWRVALLFWYLGRVAGLSLGPRVLGTLLPPMLIVVTLTFLNLERAVFSFMSSSTDPPTAHDGAYAFVVALSLLSLYAAIPILIWYVTDIWLARELAEVERKARQMAAWHPVEDDESLL